MVSKSSLNPWPEKRRPRAELGAPAVLDAAVATFLARREHTGRLLWELFRIETDEGLLLRPLNAQQCIGWRMASGWPGSHAEWSFGLDRTAFLTMQGANGKKDVSDAGKPDGLAAACPKNGLALLLEHKVWWVEVWEICIIY